MKARCMGHPVIELSCAELHLTRRRTYACDAMACAAGPRPHVHIECVTGVLFRREILYQQALHQLAEPYSLILHRLSCLLPRLS